MANLRRRWTPADDATLRRRRAEGRSAADIADELGRSIYSVNVRAVVLGLTDGKKRQRGAGRGPWTSAEMTTLLRLRAAGASTDRIAAALPERTAKAVRRQIQKYAAARAPGPQAKAAACPPPALPAKRTRACLCCGKDYLSDGSHNRLCNPCRLKSVLPQYLYA